MNSETMVDYDIMKGTYTSMKCTLGSVHALTPLASGVLGLADGISCLDKW
jgi:hypothetical protein